nr:hypothetical protein [Tanacetum cinerariifolium]
DKMVLGSGVGLMGGCVLAGMVSGSVGKKLENGAYSFGGKRVNSAQCIVTLKGRG